MAGNQNSRKKTTSTKKQTTGKKKTAVKKEQIYTEPVMDEIKLIAILAVSILILLSVFGLGGRVGDTVAYLFFGLFGILAYVLPFVLFISIAFHMSNRKSKIAHIKIAAAVMFLFMILAIITVSDPSFDTYVKMTDGFLDSAASHQGGGLIGYCFGWIFYGAFGQIGSTVIFVGVMLISGVLVTGKRIFVRLGSFLKKGLSGLWANFRDYREARAEELQREEEELEALAELEAADEKYRKKKNAANIVINQSVDARIEEKSVPTEEDIVQESKDECPVIEPVIETVSEPVIETDASDVVSKKPFTREHLDSFDHGQPIEPLHIKVPEFMKGGKLSESSMGSRTGSTPEKQTKLTVQDLNLEIKDIDDKEDELEEQKTETNALKEQKTEQKTEEKKEANALKEQKTEAEPVQIIEENVEKYEFPPLDLLEKGSNAGQQQSAASLKQTALKLQQTFDSFGVGVQITNVSCGPAVTRYELQPDQGVKVSRIVSLSDDIKLNLAVADIRMEAPIPGKAAVGIEVPNKNKEMVRLRDLLESDATSKMKSKLAFVVGKDIGGQPVVADIEKMPHLLIAGATGSGKSVCINTIVMSILYRADPNEVKMIMIDPKVVELNVYNGLPHLLIPVVTDPKKAAGALNWAVATMMERYNKFAEIGAKDIKSYNARIESISYESETHQKMPQIVIIIDELADLMMVAQSEVEDAICRLAQLARAAGIHLVIATQRPSVNVITGLIKANVPSRIAFSVSSGVDSRTILDMNGAEKLLGNGDMLFYPQGYQKPVRVQGAFVSENEIGRVTDFIRAHMNDTPAYNEEITSKIESASTGGSIGTGSSASNSDRDIYFEEAGRFVIEKEKASIGMLQRVYKIGFNRAARIMDQLCDAGVVGPDIGTKPRQIVMTMEEFEQYLSEH